jgi:hypothetical protein
MDRRIFFKTFLSTSLLTPLILSSRNTKNSLDLYLITDRPQDYFPLILKESGSLEKISSRFFRFLNPHPQNRALSDSLVRSGWTQAGSSEKASLCLSFSRLDKGARPSFTLVREGRILDPRTRKLHTLWRKMNSQDTPSKELTVLSLQPPDSKPRRGKSASVFRGGTKLVSFSLGKDSTRTFQTKQGQITVRVHSGAAWVEQSSCRHRICCLTPPVSLAGERIVCAPNHFLLEVDGPRTVDTVIG